MSIQLDARALYEAGWLDRYFVPFALAHDGPALKAAALFERITGLSLRGQLMRRAVTEVPGAYLRTFPAQEIWRTAVALSRPNSRTAADLLVRSQIGFDRHVAARIGKANAVFAYGLSAQQTFAEAKRKGLFCIYGVRGFHPRFEAAIGARERERHPHLAIAKPRDAFLEERVARRQASLQMADLVIFTSAVARDSHRPYGLDMSKTKVVPMAFPPLGPEVDVSAVERGPLRILWAGSFFSRKGAPHFLEALKRLQNSIEFEARVFGALGLPQSSLSGISRIRVSPTIPRSQLFEEYRKADVLVLPTLSEGSANVVSEAMSQGLPVVTTPNAGSSEMIRNGESGLLVEVGDIDGLTESLRWCALNRPQLRRMGAAARQAASEWQGEDYRKALANVLAEAFAARTSSAASWEARMNEASQ